MRHVNLWPLVLGGIVATTAYLTLRPFQFWPVNQARWTDQGLAFGGRGVAYTAEDLQWTDESASPALSLELWVEPATVHARQSGVILSLDDGSASSPLYIRQWRGGLGFSQLRKNTQGRWERHTPALPGLLAPGPHHVVLTSNSRATILYLDGQATRVRSGLPVVTTRPALRARLVLGCTPAGGSPWSGRVWAVAAYDQALSPNVIEHHFRRLSQRGPPSLDDEPHLLTYTRFTHEPPPATRTSSIHTQDVRVTRWSVPTRFNPPQRRVLELPGVRQIRSPGLVWDAWINIVGFVPFGLAAGCWARRHGGLSRMAIVLTVVTAGAALSLSLELLQALEPSRMSSALDWLCNSTGTAVGVAVAMALRPVGRRWPAWQR